MKKIAIKLTKTELEIMRYFWSININEELTATDIRTHFSNKKWSKQVTSTFLTKLVKKNYLKVRKISAVKYYYSVAITEEEYNLLPTKNIINTVFKGSYSNFMYSLVDPQKNDLSEEELKKIENMIAKRRMELQQQKTKKTF